MRWAPAALLLSCGALALATVVRSETTIVVNGGFESADSAGKPVGWLVDGGQLEQVSRPEGGFAGRLTTTATGQIKQTLPNVAGKELRATAQLSATAPSSSVLFLEVVSQRPDGASPDVVRLRVSITGAWLSAEVPYFLVAGDALSSEVRVRLAGESAGEVWIDDVVVLARPGPTTTPTVTPTETATATASRTAPPTRTATSSPPPGTTPIAEPSLTPTLTPRPASATPIASRTPSPALTPTPTPGGPSPTRAGELLISEVMADPIEAPEYLGEWVELYNPTATAWWLAGCALEDNGGRTALPADALVPPGGFVVLAASERVRNDYAVPSDFFAVGRIGNGLANVGDRVVLRCGDSIIDRLSWGSDASALSPPPPSPGRGRSLARLDLVPSDRPHYTTNRAPSPGWARIVSRDPVYLPAAALRTGLAPDS